ncbi:MAG TPA: hypothetical protein VIX58_12070 [Anaerolineae bacterium]
MARGVLIAEGVYHYIIGTNETAREAWTLSRLGHGGNVFDTRIDSVKPTKQSWVVTYELTSKWLQRGVTIRVDQDHQVMRTEQTARAKKWSAHVESPAGAQDFTLDFSPSHQVWFASPIFASVVLVRIAPAEGNSSELETIVIQPGSLAPTIEKQTWSARGEDKVQVPAGEFSALKFEMSNASGTTQIWSDSHGTILRLAAPDGSQVQLASYLRHGRN